MYIAAVYSALKFGFLDIYPDTTTCTGGRIMRPVDRVIAVARVPIAHASLAKLLSGQVLSALSCVGRGCGGGDGASHRGPVDRGGGRGGGH